MYVHLINQPVIPFPLPTCLLVVALFLPLLATILIRDWTVAGWISNAQCNNLMKERDLIKYPKTTPKTKKYNHVALVELHKHDTNA